MSLIAWYPLHKDIKDYSLNGYDLYNTNSSHVTLQKMDGKLGSCYNFDGKGCLKNTADIWKTFDVSEFTMMGWIKPTSTGSPNNGSIGIMNDGLISFTLLFNSSSPRLQVYDNDINNWRYYKCDYTLQLNVWTHVAVVIKDNKFIFYINGLKVNTGDILSSNINLPDSDTFFCIGCDWPGGDEYYIGKINDVRVYDEAISSRQIKEISRACIVDYGFNDPYVQPITNLYTTPHFNSNNMILDYNYETNIFLEYGFTKALKIAPGDYATNNMSYTFLIDPKVLEAGKVYTVALYAYNSADCNTDIILRLEYDFTIIASIDTVEIKGITNGKYINNTTKGKVQLIWITFKANNITEPTRLLIYPNLNSEGVFTTGYQLYAGIQIYEGDNVLLPSPFKREGIISDLTCLGNNAHLNEETAPQWNFDKQFGLGSYTLAENKYINIRIPQLSSDQLSISLWVNFNNTNTGYLLFAECGLLIEMQSNGNLRFRAFCNDEAEDKWSPNSLFAPVDFDNLLHNIILTIDKNIYKVYIDGILKTSINDGKERVDINTVIDQYIGYRNSSYLPCNATIYDFKLYTTVLSEKDVEEIYSSRYFLDIDGNFYCSGLLKSDTILSGDIKFKENSLLEYNDIDELGIYGMEYKRLDDGSEWAKIFHHYNHNGAVFFTSNEEALNIQTKDKYSRLYLLENFRNTEGKFEFLLEYPDDLPGEFNRWKQTSNPAAATTPNSGVTGYEVVHIDWTGNSWGGLEYNGGACLIDGSVNHTNWFYSIGSKIVRNGAIPGPINPIQCVELWVRINTININKDLMGWWPLNGNLKDISGYNQKSTNKGAEIVNSDRGLVYQLDKYKYINLGINMKDFINTYKGFTLSIFMNKPTYDNAIVFGGTGWDWGIIVHNMNALMVMWQDVDGIKSSHAVASPIEKDKWYHVIGSYDQSSNTIKVYINGELKDQKILQGTIYVDNPTSHGLLELGGEGQRGTTVMISDARLYNRALTDTEVSALYKESMNESKSFKMTKDHVYMSNSFNEI